MKHARPFAIAAILVAGLFVASPIDAQQAQLDISGRWKFKTDVLPNKGCVISGEIEFTRRPRSAEYACKFVSREDCNRPGGPTFTEVEQLCSTATLKGEIAITSSIGKILDAGPADFKEAMFASQAYAPDHFKLRPSGGDLIGIFHSTRQAKVRFWRDQDLVG